MSHLPAKISTIAGAAVLIAALMVTCCHGSDDIRIEGRVVDAGTGMPLDSVRVASLHNKIAVLSRSDGQFSLRLDEKKTCVPETLSVDSLFEYRVHTVSSDTRFGSGGATNVPVAASLVDLRGRTVQKSLFGNVVTPFPAKGLPGGVYILTIGGRTPQRLLVTDNYRPGVLVKKQYVELDIRPPDCTVPDSIVFYRDGYASIMVPVGSVESGATVTLRKKRWVACDIHSHTVLTDGAYIQDSVLAHAFGEGGLDVVVNAEHGGVYYRDTAGVNGDADIPRWLSLVKYSWPKLLGQRRVYPGKILLQGLEWNCPGHEHASVGFVDDVVQPEAIARFEYQFDFNDYDIGMPGLTKFNGYRHENAVVALEWLAKNYPTSGYLFINHPSREAIGPYYIEHFRDFHTTAPGIFLGFEGMPGHHKNSMRGDYRYGPGPQNRTWGGADYTLARVGGLWDALLGEGRRLWTIVNSDFHTIGPDFWPGVYGKTRVAVTDTGARAWLDGIKTGELFIAHGDLITDLTFSIDDRIRCASMGSEMRTGHKELLFTIRFKSPPVNNNGDSVRVDHIDLIAGAITGKISPASLAYKTPVNPTTAVLSRFSAVDWVIEDGYTVIRTVVPFTQSAYYRLRGTNLAVGTPGEVDGQGNPLMDEDYSNTEADSWNDLWFYSNPVFVYKR